MKTGMQLVDKALQKDVEKKLISEYLNDFNLPTLLLGKYISFIGTCLVQILSLALIALLIGLALCTVSRQPMMNIQATATLLGTTSKKKRHLE